jgi:predicted phage-related endonuclease
MTPGERIERRQYLGASEVAAVIGMDPFKGAHDLWSEKMGLLGESEESEAAEMGKLLESPILQRYEPG